MPSMVVTLAPSAWPASTVHDFTALPSMCTVQAPHWLVSQPTWVPVRPRSRRIRSTSSVAGLVSSSTGASLTVMRTFKVQSSPIYLSRQHQRRGGGGRDGACDHPPDRRAALARRGRDFGGL